MSRSLSARRSRTVLHENNALARSLADEVGRVFGEATREHVARLCRGELCFLQYLPSALQVRVLAQLDLLDLRRLALVSRHFHQVRPEQSRAHRPLPSSSLLSPLSSPSAALTVHQSSQIIRAQSLTHPRAFSALLHSYALIDYSSCLSF